MSDETENKGLFSLPIPALGSFLNVAEAKRVSKSAKEEPKFSGSFELDPEVPAEKAVLGGLRAKIIEVAQAKWPGKNIGDAIRAGELVVPISDGTKLAEKAIAKGKKREWSRGKQVITARSQYQPECSIIEGGHVVVLGEDAIKQKAKTHFYTGARVLAQFNLVAYDAVGENGKPGVTAYLNIVCSTGKGEKLISGGDRSAEVFKGYIGLASEEDPTGSTAASSSDW